jgi:hypothetical protein
VENQNIRGREGGRERGREGERERERYDKGLLGKGPRGMGEGSSRKGRTVIWTQSKDDICMCENTVKPINVCSSEKFKRQ